jgi:hypothetical protein
MELQTNQMVVLVLQNMYQFSSTIQNQFDFKIQLLKDSMNILLTPC